MSYENVAITYVRDDDGWDQGGSSRGGKSDEILEIFLKTELAEIC